MKVECPDFWAFVSFFSIGKFFKALIVIVLMAKNVRYNQDGPRRNNSNRMNNKRVATAFSLFDKLTEDFKGESFTLKGVVDTYNDLGKSRGETRGRNEKGVRFNQAHLDILVKFGMLTHSNKEYAIDYASSSVAERMIDARNFSNEDSLDWVPYLGKVADSDIDL